MSRGHLFVISAPSGTGKTTVIKRVLKECPHLVLSISYTTRDQRDQEKAGGDYHYISEDKFREMIEADEFVEWAPYAQALYGTPRKPIEEWLAQGKSVVLDIDIQGGKAIREIFPEATLIFLLPPSKKELTRRLQGRGTGTPDELRQRLYKADLELGEKDRYDYQVVNDKVKRAAAEVRKIIVKHEPNSG